MVTIKFKLSCYDFVNPDPERIIMRGKAEDITGLLKSWRTGDRSALDRLLPLIQRELLRLAQRHLARERKGHSMQPSCLVQEAFLRLLPGREMEWGIGRISSRQHLV